MLRYVQRPSEASWFERPDGMSPMLHRLLMQRGIASAEQAAAFLQPSADQLHDPFLLNDMPEAAARIRRAMAAGERICVWGDYDVDGVSASAILYDYFREAGVDARVYLPSRHNEGYGLNEAGIREIAPDTDLLITVDCGISAHDLIELAKALGMDCIVTDHHRPGDILPECPVVNPLLKDYPFPWLCGAGVAFKLVHALGGIEAAMDRIDLAAIATVADVVSLTGENRAIVHLGLKRINAAPRPGVAALLECARVEPGTVRSETIAFRLAPRLNAGGRLGSARRSYELLIQQDAFLAVAQADELEMENQRRQSIEREIRAQAEEQLKDYDFSAHRILMVHGSGWNSGVIGLTASHLKEKYHYPVIALSEADGMLTGSCRSIEGVDIYQALASAAELLEKFGGHRQAAGLSVRAENLEKLQAALDRYLFENVAPDAWTPAAEYDILASLDEFTEAFVQAMDALEPTGCGNPEPVFRAEVRMIEGRAIGAQGAHLRLICAENGVRRTGIYFGAGELANTLGESAEILFTPQLNCWNGRTDVQLRLCALKETNYSARIHAAKPEEGRILRKFLTELFYNNAYNCIEGGAEISAAELKRLLAENPQGTWMICGDLNTAETVLQAVSPCAPDLSIGCLPADVRCFNSLIVCPDCMRGLPRGLRRLIYIGMPPLDADAQGAEILHLSMAGALGGALPDVDEMREVYKAARRILKRPAHAPNLEALVRLLADEAEINENKCHASLMALQDMKLLELRQRPFALALLPMQKTDPESSALWRAMQRFKGKLEMEREGLS